MFKKDNGLEALNKLKNIDNIKGVKIDHDITTLASGIFQTTDGMSVTVVDGIITDISTSSASPSPSTSTSTSPSSSPSSSPSNSPSTSPSSSPSSSPS